MNIFDGWVKGGILLLGLEVATELGYPHSESLTSGFVLALEAVMKWPFAVALGILIQARQAGPTEIPPELIPYFISIMALYLVCNVAAIVLIRKSPFYFKRSESDMVDIDNTPSHE